MQIFADCLLLSKLIDYTMAEVTFPEETKFKNEIVINNFKDKLSLNKEIIIASSIGNLSEHILYLIFSYLDTCTIVARTRLVSVSWMKFVDSESLWNNVKDLAFHLRKFSDGFFLLLRKCQNLSALKISGPEQFEERKKLNANLLLDSFKSLQKLESLSLHQFYIPTFKLENFPNLNSVNLAHSYVSYDAFKDLADMKNLKKICIPDLSAGEDEEREELLKENDTLITIIENCTRIEHLNFQDQGTLDFHSFYSVFIRHSHSLRSLNLAGIVLGDECFYGIQFCKNLTELEFDCTAIDGPMFLYLKDLPLKLLHIQNDDCLLFLDALRDYLKYGCLSDLRHFAISSSNLKYISIKILADRCPELVSVRIISCKKLTDKSIMAIIRNCPKLTSLSIFDVRLLTGTFLSDMHMHTKFLNNLGIGFCKNVKLASVHEFLRLNPAFKLEETCNWLGFDDMKPKRCSEPTLYYWDGQE